MTSLATELLGLKNQLTCGKVIFCYSGYLTQEVLEGIGIALRAKLAIDQTERKVAKNLFSVFVEQVQNVARYSAEKEGGKTGETETAELRHGILLIGKDETGYFVACGNQILDEDVPQLRTSLTDISKMNREELMALYKQTLKSGPPAGSKGAGVGFLDIARLATGGIEFDFLPIETGLSFFTFKARM